MGTFVGHAIPGSLFVVVGLWHLFSSFCIYASKPESFRSRVWHPVPSPTFRNLELLLVIILGFMDMVPVELMVATHFQPLVDGGIPVENLNNFQHASIILGFFVLYSVAYLSEASNVLSLPSGSLHLIATAAYLNEALLFLLHATNHLGVLPPHHSVEPRYHAFLALIVLASALFSFLGVFLPHSFLLDTAANSAMLLQGLWFWQAAFSLYGPLRARGCSVVNDSVQCESEEEDHRAMALATLHFSTLLFGTIAFVLLLYGCITARSRSPHRRLRGGYSDTESGQEMARSNGVDAGSGGGDVEYGNGVDHPPKEPFKVAYETGDEEEEGEGDESLLLGMSKLGVTP